MTFTAKYRSKCASCLEDIDPGQEAHFVDGAIEHFDCEVAVAVPVHRAPVCKTCWIEKPCECDD